MTTEHGLEYVPCRYCGRTIRRRAGAKIDWCERRICMRQHDADEIRAMDPADQEAYWAASNKYYGELEAKRDREAGRLPAGDRGGPARIGVAKLTPLHGIRDGSERQD